MNLDILRGAGIDTEELMNTLMDNEDVLVIVLNKFLLDKNYERLEQSFSSKDENMDYKAIELYSHTLKGTTATLEMTNLHLCLAKLVENVRTGKYSGLRDDFDNVKLEYNKIIDAILKWKVVEEIF